VSPARQLAVVLIKEPGDVGGGGRKGYLPPVVSGPSLNRRLANPPTAISPRWPSRQAIVVAGTGSGAGDAASAAVEVPPSVPALPQRPAPRHRLPEILIVDYPSETAGQAAPDVVEGGDQRARDGIHSPIQSHPACLPDR
jgi:hypothetical protein